MATIAGSSGRRPPRATPAERAVVFQAEQQRLKDEAADRRAAAEARAAAKPARKKHRRG